MIRYLMKNNFKLMFRNRWAIFFLLIAPLLTVFLVSDAFGALMRSYEVPDEFSVGYRDNGCIISESMEKVKEAAKDNGIILTECSEGEPKQLIEQNGFSAFIEFNKSEYTVYKSEEHKTECSVTEYFIGRIMEQGTNNALKAAAPGSELTSSLPVTKIDFMPPVNSSDYYGIAYVIWYGSLGMAAAAGILNSEKKYGIEKKYRASTLSSLQMYLSRLIPTVAVTLTVFLAVALISVLFYDISWGSPMLSAVIAAMFMISAAAFGFMIYSITQNMAFTVTMMITVTFAMGFVGGSFETYMFSSTPQTIKEISPIYHANRALVELSVMGHSSYIKSSLIYSAVLTGVCSAAAVFADVLRKKVKSC